MANTFEQPINYGQTSFAAGISQNSKSGLPESCRFSRFLNIYDDDDSVTLNPRGVKVSGNVVTDVVNWIHEAAPFNNNQRWAYGSSGNVYMITTNDAWLTETWSLYTTIAGSHGNGEVVFNDYLWLASDDNLTRIGPLSTGGVTPTIVTNVFDNTDALIDPDINRVSTAYTGFTFTLPTSITAAAETDVTMKIPFVPSYAPVKEIVIDVAARGTGNWTFTLHDTANQPVAAPITIPNATLPASGLFTLVIPSPYWVTLTGASYHLHITSSVADGSVVTGLANDISFAYIQSIASALFVDAAHHPMALHNNGVGAIWVIGNGKYLGDYDGSVYSPTSVGFESGFSARQLVRLDEYIVALTWRGPTIDTSERGVANFWDGIQDSFNYSKPITGGQPHSGANFKSNLFTIVGVKGDMNIGVSPFRKIQPMPKLARGKILEVAPGGVDVWDSKVHMGVALNTNDAVGLEQGVYVFGNQSDRKQDITQVSTEVLNFGYAISTGTTQSLTMSIGCVKAFGQNMYVSWQDGANYGVDRINRTNDPSPIGSWESLIFDRSVVGNQLAQLPQKPKNGIKVVTTFDYLPVGCTVASKYRLDRATTGGTLGDGWFQGPPATVGDNRAESIVNQIGGGRYKEIEYGYEITATVNYPTLTGCFLEFDPLTGEEPNAL